MEYKFNTATQGQKVYYNPKNNPKYIVKSNTSHNGDAFKGFDSLKDLKNGNRTGSFDINFNKVGD